MNVLVSSLITRGKPRDLFLKARDGQFTLILSDQIVSELIDVVGRRKFARYVDEHDVRVFLEALHRIAVFTKVRSRFRVVEDDPQDDIILRTAYDSGASHIVSGDKHLLALAEFRGMRIMTVDDMLRLLGRGQR